jgi:hypothetical protein
MLIKSLPLHTQTRAEQRDIAGVYRESGWVEDTMNRRDRVLLGKQMKHFQPSPRRDGVMVLILLGLFVAGLTAGSFLITAGSRQAVQTTSDDGKTALAFFLNGTGKTAR